MAKQTGVAKLDEGLIDDLGAQGMRPALQARSRKLVVRLFGEGLALLNQVDFDGLSVEILCARAGSTVGAFYSRFENKEAFIEALQRLVTEQARQRIVADYETGVPPEDDLAHLIGWITKGSVVWYRRYEGLIRASLRRASGVEEMWTPMRELGRLHIDHAMPRLIAMMTPLAHDGAKERIGFAFQLMFGALNNMVLINPGPFTLDNPATARMLAAAMIQFIASDGVSVDKRASLSRPTSKKASK